jgi:DNA-binding MarR family transcriptional regulator
MNINRAENGFIKIHYKIKDSDLWQDHTALFVFIRMLFFAHFEDDFTSIRFAGKQRYLKRGEFSATVAELAEYLGIPQSTLRKAIQRLEEGKRLDKRTDRQTTVFRICNYSKYQDSPARARTNGRTNEVANDRTNDRANVTEGKKNIKNIKNNNSTNVLLGETPSYGNSEINDLFSYWHQIVGYEISANSKNNRRACSNLLKKHGAENTRKLIDGVNLASQDKYAPGISDFVELQTKLSALLLWGKKKGTSTNGTLVI